MGPLVNETVYSYVGEGAPVLIRRALGPGATDGQIQDALEFFLAYYNEHLIDHTVLYPGDTLAVAGNHDAVIVLLCSDHTFTAGSIWLGIGFSVRMSMMLISLKSVVQAASEPLHAASDCVSRSHTSVGWFAETPRDSRNAAMSFGMKSQGHGITIAFRSSSRT
jgi:hypothetical protein